MPLLLHVTPDSVSYLCLCCCLVSAPVRSTPSGNPEEEQWFVPKRHLWVKEKRTGLDMRRSPQSLDPGSSSLGDLEHLIPLSQGFLISNWNRDQNSTFLSKAATKIVRYCF